LRDKEALNKVLWKIYYEKPYTDLVGRVIGNKTKCGIYKITNLENQMCYIGQSVDLASRWKQHLKRGIGAEIPTKNKLYPAMLATGVENFSFEVIEECPASELNEKEKFWQNHFNAMTYGYSMR
jgi:group I intron endonuclease